jgi:lysophospholipase L1-like esterase
MKTLCRLLLFLLLAISCSSHGAPKLACFGDSVTSASDISPAPGFCTIMGNAQNFSNIYNFGKSGDWSTNALTRVSSVLAVSPTCTTVNFGINDVAPGHATPPPKFKANITSIVQQLLKGGSEVTLMTPNLVRSTEYGLRFPPYLQAIRDVASEQNVPLLDLYSMFAEVYFSSSDKLWNTWYFDALHPSAQGHQAIAGMCALTQNKNACACKAQPRKRRK